MYALHLAHPGLPSLSEGDLADALEYEAEEAHGEGAANIVDSAHCKVFTCVDPKKGEDQTCCMVTLSA